MATIIRNYRLDLGRAGIDAHSSKITCGPAQDLSKVKLARSANILANCVNWTQWVTKEESLERDGEIERGRYDQYILYTRMNLKKKRSNNTETQIPDMQI